MSYISSVISCTVRGKKEQESEENVRHRIVHMACFCLYEKKVRGGEHVCTWLHKKLVTLAVKKGLEVRKEAEGRTPLQTLL